MRLTYILTKIESGKGCNSLKKLKTMDHNAPPPCASSYHAFTFYKVSKHFPSNHWRGVAMKKLIYYSGDILSVKGCKLCKKKNNGNIGGGDLLLV